jgi:ABC-type branched-subunit amino acid transport system substrate-binding protein
MSRSTRLHSVALTILVGLALAAPTTAQPAPPPATFAAAREAEAQRDVAKALGLYQQLLGTLRPEHEKAFVDARVRALLAPLDLPAVRALLPGLVSGTRVAALASVRLAELLIAAGQERAARTALQQAAAQLAPAERAVALTRSGDPTRLGALVPLTGPNRFLGRELLAGMVLAADLTTGSRGPGATLVVRDSAPDPQAAAEALAARGVVAAVGLPSSPEARRAAPALHRLGLPTLSAADGVPLPHLGAGLLRAGHPPPVRAAALARHFAASRPGAAVVVVHPANLYGRRTADAFVAEATRLQLRVVARVAYPPTATTLYKHLAPLAGKGAEAVFVADSASRLELVAPQLALAGLPVGANVRGARMALLSTAEGLGERLVKNVATSVAGAVLAPDFYPDPADPELRGFIQGFQRAHGRLPSRYAALGYLAVQHLRTLLVSDAQGRVSLGRALVGRAGRHDATGELTGAPRLYRVEGAVIRRFAPRR